MEVLDPGQAVNVAKRAIYASPIYVIGDYAGVKVLVTATHTATGEHTEIPGKLSIRIYTLR